MLIKIIFILALFIFFSSAEEIQITPDKDNTIYSESDTTSNGAGQFLFAGRTNNGNIRRALIHFDITGAIPAGSIIESVTLTMAVSKTRGGTVPVYLHNLTSNWGEGTSDNGLREGGGAPATKYDATWNQAFYDSLSWNNPGADFNPDIIDSAEVGGIASYTWTSNTDMAATVQDWLDNPQNNFGWLVQGDETDNQSSKRFDSREGMDKPTLTVTYTTITAIVPKNNGQADKFILSDNYPNPFNPATKMDITVPVRNNQNITLKIYNITGQLVKTIYSGLLSSGKHTLAWDGKNINDNKAASGLYFYSLKGSDFEIMKKMILLK